VVGYDLSPQTMPDLPSNVSIHRADARNLPGGGPFDLVYCLDSLDHIRDPASVLKGVHRALVPGGVVLVADNDLTGDLDQDAESASALIAYTSSVIYCLQEALAGGGVVHSCAEGPGWVMDAMEQTDFAEVTVHHSETGYAIIHGVA
jgi:SAM-dependent methyltransferase